MRLEELIELAFITFLATSNYLHAQDECMAVALHHESRGEQLQGQRAVMDVILNRSYSSLSSPCSVIKKPSQFSFVSKNTSWRADGEQMERLMKVKKTKRILDLQYQYYHTLNVSPVWSKSMTGKRKLGNHLFMKLKEK